MAAQEIRVPDTGDFSDVPIIEIHVAAGDAGGTAPKETVTSQPAESLGTGAGTSGNGVGPKEELSAPAGYGSSAAPPSGHDRAAAPVGAPARTPGRRVTCTPRSWSWVLGRAATPPRSAPPTSASAW